MRALRATLMAALLVAALVAGPAHADDGGGPGAVVELEVAWRTAADGLQASTVVPLPDDTTVVGLDWGGSTAEVSLRQQRDGRWGAWSEIHADADEGPDPDSREARPASTWSAPVIVAGAEAVQLRSTTRDVRALAVVVGSSQGSTATADEHVAASASSGATPPGMLARADWGADESLRDQPHYAPTVRFAVIHHTAGSNNYSRAASRDIVRGIYLFHVRVNGWSDIGYNFLVDKYGQVFEGRYGGADRAVQGAHAAGFNSGSVGIAVLGDYTNHPITAAARASVEELLAWKFGVHNTSPVGTTTEVAGNGSRFTRGERVPVRRIAGHRHLGYTTCPGSIVDLIDRGVLASAVEARMGPRIHTDFPDAPSVSIIGQPTEITAFTSADADWRLVIRAAGGRVVHAETWQSVRRITARWDHRDADGVRVPTGDYTATLRATLRDGTALQPVTIPIDLGVALPGWRPLTGDWNGDGRTQRGWWDRGRWVIENGTQVLSFPYGRPQDAPIVGDWNGDGRDEIGIIRDREWHLRDQLAGGVADRRFIYGRMTRGDQPLVGDWNGDGRDEIGITRDRQWHLRNQLAGGVADRVFTYGRITAGDIPLTGDWNGDGRDGIGIIRGDTWYLRAGRSGGEADWVFPFGRVSRGDAPVVGDWDGNGRSGIGVVRDTDWLLRDELSGGPATSTWAD